MLLVFLLVKNVDNFYFPRVEKPVVVPEILFWQFDFWPYWIAISQLDLLDLCLWLNDVTVSNVTVVDVWEDPKDVVWSDFHSVLSFDVGFEDDKCFFLNDVVVTKDNFKWFLLPFAQYWAGGVNDTALSENDIALDLVLTHVDCFLTHFCSRYDIFVWGCLVKIFWFCLYDWIDNELLDWYESIWLFKYDFSNTSF